jgi:ankyrin repeat protein
MPSPGRDRGVIVPLPKNPSMTWLRKAAKDELAALTASNPDAQLSDAQLVIARRHGFASWRALKAFVDAMHDEGAALRLAVREGDLAKVTAILDRHPALIHATDDLDPDPEQRERPVDTRGMRLLHLCVAEDRIDVARLLIARGADLDARNNDGRTALHDSFELNRDHIAELLMASGAAIDVCAAVAYRKRDRLREILRADPSQANDLTTGLTPLGWSGFANDEHAAQLLVDHGAIVDRPPYDHEAWGPTAMCAYVPVAKILLAAGAGPNWADAERDTVLHHVLASPMVIDPSPFVACLLAAGADPTRTNDRGLSALDDALTRNGESATTYFPKIPLGAKKLDATIALLRDAAAGRAAEK